MTILLLNDQNLALGVDDLDCADDLTPEMSTVSGRLALVQALYRRWTTDRGGLIGDPNYGENLTNSINDEFNQSQIGQVISAAIAEAKKEERLLSIVGNGTFDEADGTLYLEFVITDAEGPFTLTVSVTDVTLEILQVAA